MYLRNKKTGEIKEVIVGGYPVSGKTKMWECSEMDMNEETGYKSLGTYTSLTELNEEWEDVSDEPKEYYYIYANQVLKGECDGIIDNRFKEIGNYFETKEEAEKAVEKLKAWKRLKDKGFRLDAVVDKFFCLDIFIKDKQYEEIKDDLKIVFGGNDESNQ